MLDMVLHWHVGLVCQQLVQGLQRVSHLRAVGGSGWSERLGVSLFVAFFVLRVNFLVCFDAVVAVLCYDYSSA